MKQNEYQSAFPGRFAVVIVTLLTTVFLANASSSFAASGKKKSSNAVQISAVERTESHIKQLNSTLNIKEDQKELWNNMTQVMRDNAKEMDALSKERAVNNKNMNAVDRLKFHSEITEVHLAQLKKLIPAFESLYAGMSDEQKKITDAVFMTGKHGKKTIK